MDKCLVCDSRPAFSWTDTHGIGVCVKCGTPYAIYLDGEDNKRIDVPPACALKNEGLDIAKRYWGEIGDWVFPGSFDMGFSSRRGTTYSGATREQMHKFNEWCEANVKSEAA